MTDEQKPYKEIKFKRGTLEMGKGVRPNDALIDSTGGVYLGDYVHFGHQVMVLTTSHPPEELDGAVRREKIDSASIRIGEHSYVGSRCLILKGVQIGKSSYIAAGSVVKENTKIGDYELWAGNPAVFKRKLK